MPPILTLTLNPALDVSASVPTVVPENKLRLEAVRHEPGGGGVNVARAVQKLGGGARALFPAGGAAGERILDLLRAEGVPCASTPISASTRESLTVSETTGERQFRFVMPGPDLDESEWKACLESLRGTDEAPEVLVFSGSLPPGVPADFPARFAEVGRSLGSRVLLDTSGEALDRAIESSALLIKPNLREFLRLTGADHHDDDTLVRDARLLLDRGSVQALVISLGAGGALLVTRRSAARFASPAVPIRSRVGAGDSMVAGMALALSRSDDLDDAVRLGVAAGAAAVMTPGSELCRREDAEPLYRQTRRQALSEASGDPGM